MLETVCYHSCMIYSRPLIEGFCRIVLADNDSEVTCRVKENLITTDPVNLFKRNWFAMPGQLWKCLLFTYAVGIPCHIRNTPRGHGFRRADLNCGNKLHTAHTAGSN